MKLKSTVFYSFLIIIISNLIAGCSSSNSKWKPPNEPSNVKSLRIQNEDKNCKIKESFFDKSDCESYEGKIPKVNWIFIREWMEDGDPSEEVPDGIYPTYQYIANVRRKLLNKNIVRFDELTISTRESMGFSKINGWYERDYIVISSSNYQVDCGVNPPLSIKGKETAYTIEDNWHPEDGLGIAFRDWICETSK